jgi:hypothetical protein
MKLNGKVGSMAFRVIIWYNSIIHIYIYGETILKASEQLITGFDIPL